VRELSDELTTVQSEENCKFLRKVVREVQSDSKSVSKSTVFGTRESYTVTKVTEYFWSFHLRYSLFAYMGNETDKPLVIQQRTGLIELKTSTDATPRPATVVRDSLDLNITWLLQHLEAGNKPKFSIDRQAKSCHTPRRNADIDAAVTFNTAFHAWAGSVHGYFTNTVGQTLLSVLGCADVI
jgi:hypothetical protein